MDFTQASCPSCNWTPKDSNPINLHYCELCHAQTVLIYKTRWLCVDCYQVEYAKPENYFEDKALIGTLATSDMISRFLISMGRKSVYWEKAGKEKQDAALAYYYKHKEDIDAKLKAADDKLKAGEPVRIGELMV